jgi:hypothetical protein
MEPCPRRIAATTSPAEAVRLAGERCADIARAPCLLLSVDGFLTLELPRSYRITHPFTLAGENEMTEADKERIGQIYIDKGWRAVAKGGSNNWYAVSNMDSELAAVGQVLEACRRADQKCSLYAIEIVALASAGIDLRRRRAARRHVFLELQAAVLIPVLGNRDSSVAQQLSRLAALLEFGNLFTIEVEHKEANDR